jgi:type II secretory pathway component PulK
MTIDDTGLGSENEPSSGFVLPSVLLAILALTIIVAAIIGAAKRSNDAVVLSRTQLESRLQLQGALSVVTTGLVDQPASWVPRQSPYTLAIGQNLFEVRLQASAGLVDINSAEPLDLARLFLLAGASQEEAAGLADKVADWRDADSLIRPAGAERPEYSDARLMRPKNGSFASIDELSLVLGFTRELSDCLAPFVTVDSSLPQIIGPFAPSGLSALVPVQSAGPTPALTTGSAVEIEIRRTQRGIVQVLTAVVRSTGQSQQPILIHSFQIKARPNRDEVPNCFAGRP